MAELKKAKQGRPKNQQQMKLVGIRLQVALIERLRLLAANDGLPYQTYLRKIVWDHAFKEKPND